MDRGRGSIISMTVCCLPSAAFDVSYRAFVSQQSRRGSEVGALVPAAEGANVAGHSPMVTLDLAVRARRPPARPARLPLVLCRLL